MSQSVAGGWHTTMLPPAPDFIPTIDDIRIRPLRSPAQFVVTVSLRRHNQTTLRPVANTLEIYVYDSTCICRIV